MASVLGTGEDPYWNTVLVSRRWDLLLRKYVEIKLILNHPLTEWFTRDGRWALLWWAQRGTPVPLGACWEAALDRCPSGRGIWGKLMNGPREGEEGLNGQSPVPGGVFEDGEHVCV